MSELEIFKDFRSEERHVEFFVSSSPRLFPKSFMEKFQLDSFRVSNGIFIEAFPVEIVSTGKTRPD